MKLGKRDSGVESVTYAEALECALCHGWIDGQKAAFDSRFWLQRFTPRKSDSRWSRANRESAERLIREGRMKISGLEAVEVARANGNWERAYESQSNATVPEDFREALEASTAAREFFDTLDSANRYAILYRIQSVKRAGTRARKIEQFIQMLAEHRKIHEK
jgi:uncharacterized protein YdeI (YjbR/CyaY-like superfamily)